MNGIEMTRVEFPFGRETLILETGRMARQADGAVMVQYGGTVVLVSAVIAPEVKEGTDFLPLTVEYQEKTYAAGKIPGGFFKREGRPSEKEVLTARLVDRPIRPTFPKGFCNEVQIIALVLSHDGQNDPDVLAILGASSALALAGAPVMRVGACRVGRVNGQWILNPTYAELEQSDLDIVVASTSDGVVMVELGAKEVPEGDVIEAIRFGQAHGLQTIALQDQLLSRAAVKVRAPFSLRQPNPTLEGRIRPLVESRVIDFLKRRVQKEGGPEDCQIAAEICAQLQATSPESDTGTEPIGEADVAEVLHALERSTMRSTILNTGQRLDGRDLTTVRPIHCEVGALPRAHGSALFTRGQTQALVSATLGTGEDEQMIDALQGKWYKSFMLHYSFPPFSVGEIRPVRGPGRREIGHGALAERALKAVMPGKEEFPYTIRVVSEILESNGSSSMATVCGASLALMDAGVPLKRPVAGIAMGLIQEGDRHVILTDLIGLEDHYGDMDFKVAGTAQGITALQLDLKLPGIPVEWLAEALEQSKPARALVLERMLATLPAPRPTLSPYAPRITVIKIHPDKIGDLIGPGGKTIRKLTQETGVSIDIEDDGTVRVASSDPNATEKAVRFIQSLTEEAEVGKIYQGVVKRVTNFGAFCEIAPGKEGLCHVSELSDRFVPKVEDVVKVGDTLPVKVVEIDAQGRINLSHRQALLPEGTAPVAPTRRTATRKRMGQVSEKGPSGLGRPTPYGTQRARGFQRDTTFRRGTGMAHRQPRERNRPNPGRYDSQSS